MLACAQADLAECTKIQLVHNAAQAEEARAQGLLYVFLGVEGMAAIGADLAGIDRYADAGARMGMMTWNEENLLAAGAGAARRCGGWRNGGCWWMCPTSATGALQT